MERYRLKNIIILILVLVNVSLLASLLYRKSEESAVLRRTEAELVELFAASGITLEHDAISWETPPASLSMTRSETLEQEAAGFLLGEGLRTSSQGGVNTYSTSLGTVEFRSNGSFEASGLLAAEDAEAFCSKFCREFSYTGLSFQPGENGQHTGTALLTHEKKPVYNCPITFTIQDDQLVSVSGTLLGGEGTSTGETELLSAAAALTTFQQMRLQEGTVGSSILETYLCYELQSTSSAPMTLSSAWCVVTDISSYYVNCTTGAVTSG